MNLIKQAVHKAFNLRCLRGRRVFLKIEMFNLKFVLKIRGKIKWRRTHETS